MMKGQEEILYQSVLLQFRPVVSSEERINVGVVLYAPDSGRLTSRFTRRYSRLTSLYPDLKGTAFRNMIRHLSSKVKQLTGVKDSKQGALLLLVTDDNLDALGQMLRQIITDDSGNFSWSSIRRGICRDLEVRADDLFREFISRYEGRKGRERIDDQAVWEGVRNTPVYQRIAPVLSDNVTISTSDYSYTFTAGWKNGKTQVVEPVSLDYQEPRDMLEEASRWRGRLAELARTNDFGVTIILSEPPESPTAHERYQQAKSILRRSDNLRELFTPSEVSDFVYLVDQDVEHRILWAPTDDGKELPPPPFQLPGPQT
jgi:hypothetical protein